MTQQMRVSKSGFNVLTETNPNNFIFHSLYNTFKIIATGTNSLTIGTGSTTQSFAHGLSYTPMVLAFVKYSNNRVGPPGTKDSANDLWFQNVKADATNVVYEFYNNTGASKSVTMRYYLFEVPQ